MVFRSRIADVHRDAGVQEELIPTRQSLLSRLRNWRDDDSWRDFFQTYWRLIYSASVKAGLTPTEAEEVVQETVISVSKSIVEFKYDRAKGTFKSWLLVKTRWRIAEQFRRRDTQLWRAGASLRSSENEDTVDLVERIAEPVSDELQEFWDREWEHNLFEAALERLKAKVDGRHYQVFDLYVLREWPVKKVAETLKMNAAKIYLLKHRLTALLKQELKTLEQEGID